MSKESGISYKLSGWRIPSHMIGKVSKHNPGYRVVVDIILISNDDETHSVKVTNGVTGFEQWNMKGLLRGTSGEFYDDFLVCGGTLNRWDQMGIFGIAWNNFIGHYNSTYSKEAKKRCPECGGAI